MARQPQQSEGNILTHTSSLWTCWFESVEIIRFEVEDDNVLVISGERRHVKRRRTWSLTVTVEKLASSEA
ncbi:hypothetical protein Tco_1234027 [Tanacetum coccineum]